MVWGAILSSMNTLTLEKVARTIEEAEPAEQQRLLTRLPHLLKIQPDDLALLKLADSSFDFWNNPDDTVYDYL